MKDKNKIIIVVDDNNANLIACKNILKPHYTVYPAPSAEVMNELLQNIKPNLILLDVEMPGTDGYEVARMLKGNESFREIPIIFLSARSDAKSEMEGFGLGAMDYIHKPFFSTLLLRRIEIYLSLIDHKKLIEEQENKINKLIAGISNAAKLFPDIIDNFTAIPGIEIPGIEIPGTENPGTENENVSE
jgi:putative two-component system response regulator